MYLNSTQPAFDKNKLIDLYLAKSKELENYLRNIKALIEQSGEQLEGNSFYRHHSTEIYPELLTKQLNLIWCGSLANTRIAEIGFNAGHSTLLFLLGRDETPINYTIFDIGEHTYTKPCLEYIKSIFPHVSFEFIEGDSLQTIPLWLAKNKNLRLQYDLIHVDGGHTKECILSDFNYAAILTKENGVIIIDDTNIDYISDCVDQNVNQGLFAELNVLKTSGYPHRIIQKKIRPI